MSVPVAVFEQCVAAVSDGKMIERESATDKEFHFQNWVSGRLDEVGYNYEASGRNSYPDFRMVSTAEGFEVKGLAYPGRETTYDSNSQVPTGFHNGRTIYYIFGRYPATPDGTTYPVLDLVMCHGDFLNANHEYVHKNRSVKGFGSYGDIMIRDRKMYVAPTPFGLIDGVAHRQTLIMPADVKVSDNLRRVGTLVRREVSRLIVGYEFDLISNSLTAKTEENPTAGAEHVFGAWRQHDGPDSSVSMRVGRN